MHLSSHALQSACATLAKSDAALAIAFETIGVPEWRSVPATYESLARIVTFQLLSTKAAGAIWSRVLDKAGGSLNADYVTGVDDASLRQCGLSGPKIRHLKSIAKAVHDNELPLSDMSNNTPDENRKALCAVKGIGPWTAEVFLLTALEEFDAFPHGDVGLMEAHRMLAELETRLDAKSFSEHAKSWQPYRGVAAHLLWAYINHQRDASKAY